MITFKQYIAEMAIPRESDKAKVYYHGTNNEKAARGIWEQGLDPVHTEIKYSGDRKKSNFKPQENRVYITQDLPYAMIYGIGGNMVGHDCTRDIKSMGQYGFVFEFSGSDIHDIIPDEDSIGEFIYMWLDSSGYYKKNKPDFFKKEFEIRVMDSISRLASKHLTDSQFRKVKEGEVEYWAKAGKKLIPFLTDEMRLKLIDLGAHVAHYGNIKPIKCYRFDRADVINMKRDGSNFFEYAKAWKP